MTRFFVVLEGVRAVVPTAANVAANEADPEIVGAGADRAHGLDVLFLLCGSRPRVREGVGWRVGVSANRTARQQGCLRPWFRNAAARLGSCVRCRRVAGRRPPTQS